MRAHQTTEEMIKGVEEALKMGHGDEIGNGIYWSDLEAAVAQRSMEQLKALIALAEGE